MDLFSKYAISIVWLVVLFAAYWICKFVIYRKEKKAVKNVIWQVDLKKVFLSPLKLLLLSLGVYYSIIVLSSQVSGLCLAGWINSLRDFSILVSCFWSAYRWKKELFQKKWHSLSKADMLSKIVSIAFFILFVLTALGVFHVDIVPLLAFGGIGAAAVGFAAKDVLGNFFGGGMIALTRPFSKGDTIFLPDRNLEGTVEEMGWYFTSIRDKDKCPIYFPNSLFTSIPVVNTSRMSHRRIYESFHFSYQDFAKITQITSAFRGFLSKSPKIDGKAPILVYWNEIGESSLEVVVDVYTFATDKEEYMLVRESVLQDVFSILDQLGIPMSYPKSIVQLEKENP